MGHHNIAGVSGRFVKLPATPFSFQASGTNQAVLGVFRHGLLDFRQHVPNCGDGFRGAGHRVIFSSERFYSHQQISDFFRPIEQDLSKLAHFVRGADAASVEEIILDILKDSGQYRGLDFWFSFGVSVPHGTLARYCNTEL